MKQQFHYDTVTDAIEQLRKQGFTLDLNLTGPVFEANGQQYPTDDFEIVDLYRYEGPSDPADEATVYALASKAGVKGVLVTGYGASSPDDTAAEVLKQLHYKYQQSSK